MRRLTLTLLFGLVGLVAVPASASALATSCTFDSTTTHDLVVVVGDDAASARLTLQTSGGSIQVLDANNANIVGTAACMPVMDQPTVSNTQEIHVNDAPGHSLSAVVSEQNGTFTPGFNTPPDPGVPEIDIALALLDGTDSLLVDGTDNADNFLFGQSATGDFGANLNNNESASADASDLTASSVEQVTINGRKGDDTISLLGNPGLPQIINPLVRDNNLIVDGGNQNDTLKGGAGADTLTGGTQDDELDGGGGNDTELGEADNDSLQPNDGADLEDGGDGTDLATYATRANAVNVTADGVADDGGAEDGFGDNVTPTVENINGGSGDDQLTGNALINSVTGNAGNDTVGGGFGNDKVSGSDGADRVLGQSGNDQVFGGNQNDTLVGGGENDKLTGNAGKDRFYGKKGIDRLIAKDGVRDKKLSCGKGANKRESFTKDRKDPKPKSC